MDFSLLQRVMEDIIAVEFVIKYIDLSSHSDVLRPSSKSTIGIV